MRRFAIGFIIQLALPSIAIAQWGTLDDHGSLRGKRIIDIGSLRRESASFRRNDAAGRPTLSTDSSWIAYEGTERHCLDERDLTRAFFVFELPAALLADDHGIVYLATFTADISKVRVDLIEAHWMRCPTQSTSIGGRPIRK